VAGLGHVAKQKLSTTIAMLAVIAFNQIMLILLEVPSATPGSLRAGPVDACRA
jgi:hypothetical protein